MSDWYGMRPVGLEFLDEAPLRADITVATRLARDVVWAAFVDPASWASWFPGVVEASYPDQESPFGVGTVRTANVDGQRFEETILAWDEPVRWTYRIDRCTVPLARAQVESSEFSVAVEGGTQVRWILAADPLEGMAAARDILPGILEQKLVEALSNLEKLERPA